jgi:hypothetical protein
MYTHAAPDPHDPLAPRPDDPRLGRWWRFAWMNDRPNRERWGLRWPVLIALAMLLVALGSIAVVLIAG